MPMSRSRVSVPLISFGATAVAVFALVAWSARRSWLALGEPDIVTGYTLFALILLLGFFNLRKRLSMVPVGRASVWLAFHIAAGVLVIAMFWLHTGSICPGGLYEKVLASLFYLVSVTGIIGYALSRALPRRLAQIEIEISVFQPNWPRFVKRSSRWCWLARKKPAAIRWRNTMSELSSGFFSGPGSGSAMSPAATRRGIGCAGRDRRRGGI